MSECEQFESEDTDKLMQELGNVELEDVHGRSGWACTPLPEKGKEG